MYDQETRNTDTGHKRQANTMGYSNGKHDIVHLGFGYGVCLSPRFVGKGSGQRRDIQNDFTRFFYSYRRHDWVPVWYQTHAK